jgi:hypothetical protein
MSQELQKTIILSHGCREVKRLYHKNSRVAASWPVVITCSNSVTTLSYCLKIAGRWKNFTIKTAGLQQVSQHLLLAQIMSHTVILFQGCREVERLYHKNSRVAANWPVVITCSNSATTLSYCLKVAGRCKNFTIKTAELQQTGQ